MFSTMIDSPLLATENVSPSFRGMEKGSFFYTFRISKKNPKSNFPREYKKDVSRARILY